MDFVDKIKFIDTVKSNKDMFKTLVPNLISIKLDGEYFNTPESKANITLVTSKCIDINATENVINELTNKYNSVKFIIEDVNQFNKHNKVSLEI
ncbi:hypothetical protein [Paraclostridium bifermentans]|uniref:hypothetical protein n=1 Tax=Paraclostridium bifermentans TaxID=1490 RepID=UPI00374F18E7